MSVDLRTRRDGPHPAVDPTTFFEHDLPAALRLHQDDVVPGLRWIDPRPVLFEVDGDSWTLAWTGTEVRVRCGAHDPGAHVRLTRQQLDDLVHDQQTFMSFFSGGSLDQPAGRLGHLLDWWLVLRAALDGRAIHTPGAVTFAGGDGRPLDLTRSFDPGDDVTEMRAFLESAGYLRVRNLFDEPEMAEVARDMDRAAPCYEPGDGRSWWARDATGGQHLVRMQAFDTHSERTASLLDDRRFLDLANISGVGHQFATRRADNRIEALFKPIGIVEGISDVPWHKDCSLGRHSYECCGLTVGISVTGADAVSGQLRVVAGSHRALVWPAFVRRGSDLPEIDLPTATGDVTLHLSCTMHMAQPPVERERRVMYTGFGLPAPDAAAAAAARARIREVRDAAPVTVSQPPGHTG